MFLSRLALNPRDQTARRDLACPYELHRTVLSAGFDGTTKPDLGRVLFRTDEGRSAPVVLVQSDREPDWSRLPAGYTCDRPECKPFDPQFRSAQRLRFRLRANPSKRVAAKNQHLGGVMAGRRIGLTTEEDRVAWLLRKGEAGGFTVPGEWVAVPNPVPGRPARVPNFRVDVIPEGRDRNGKNGYRDGVFVAVRFEGVLVVTDPDRFVETIRTGVGAAKAFGFGLLSVAPA